VIVRKNVKKILTLSGCPGEICEISNFGPTGKRTCRAHSWLYFLMEWGYHKFEKNVHTPKYIWGIFGWRSYFYSIKFS